MAQLYGSRTEQELDAALGAFYSQRDEYRRRYKSDNVALSFNEAVEAFTLVAPLFDESDSDSDSDEMRAIINAIGFPCFETGGFGFRMKAVEAIIEGFERGIAEGVNVLHLQHDGQEGVRQVSAWDRFVVYRALEHFVAIVSRYESDDNPLNDEERRYLERAREILDVLTVNRPRGRFDPRRSIVRNTSIFIFLHELANCGLRITSAEGDSLAGAMAVATDIPLATICDVWRDAELRLDQRRRQRRCAGCGELAGEGARRDGVGDLLCRACQTPNYPLSG